QAISHGVLQRAALPVVQNLMSRRLANVEDRFALQMMGADLVRDHDRPSSNPSGACRHGPGSASSSGWLAPPVSPSVVRTTPACGRWSARSLRTGRFAAARIGVPSSVCSGVAWVSPRFWSPGRGDTLESAASDAVERLFRTSRKSAPSDTSADKSVWGSTARRTLAQVEYCGRSQALLYNEERPHSAIPDRADRSVSGIRPALTRTGWKKPSNLVQGWGAVHLDRLSHNSWSRSLGEVTSA